MTDKELIEQFKTRLMKRDGRKYQWFIDNYLPKHFEYSNLTSQFFNGKLSDDIKQAIEKYLKDWD